MPLAAVVNVTMVDTVPSASTTLRRLRLPLSMVYRFPRPSSVIALGLLKRAAPATASMLPTAPAMPHTVVTAPLPRSMRRMVLLSVSAMYRTPPASSASPSGSRKRAATPMSSVAPFTP